MEGGWFTPIIEIMVWDLLAALMKVWLVLPGVGLFYLDVGAIGIGPWCLGWLAIARKCPQEEEHDQADGRVGFHFHLRFKRTFLFFISVPKKHG